MSIFISKVRVLTAFAIIGGALLFISPLVTNAATFTISLDKQVFQLGDEFTADIKMDTESVGINASQGTISFSPDMLSVSSVDKSTSVFNFWLQDPTFANDAGKITFLGGSTNGFTGPSLEVFKAKFKVKGIGSSTITFTDGAITASDGSGTNVMRGTQGVQITTVSKGSVTVIAPPKITRAATPTSSLPVAPKLTIPLYPDQTQWFNISAKFNVKLVLPPDVSDIITLISKDPREIPKGSEGLFDNKDFGALSDGIWYLHAQFKNNVGWGPVTHYRLAIDTQPPLPFEVSADNGSSATNPSPTLSYASADQVSGINYYAIMIDGKEVADTTSTSFTLPPQTPGKHRVLVGAHDAANNITESALDISITPIELPTIELTSKDVFTNEGGVGLNGTTLPNAKILLTLKNDAGTVFFNESVNANNSGSWSAVLNSPLNNGTYVVQAVAIDTRGAQSLPATLPPISVKDRPVLSIYGVAITQLGLIWILIAILILGFGGGFWLNSKTKKQRENRILIAERDVVNLFKTTKLSALKCIDALKDNELTTKEIADVSFTLTQIVQSIEKAEKYITDNISEID